MKRSYIPEDDYHPVVWGKSIFSFAFAIYFMLVTSIGMSFHSVLPECEHCISHLVHCEHSECHCEQHTQDNVLYATNSVVDCQDSCPLCHFFSMGQILVSSCYEINSFDIIGSSFNLSSILTEAGFSSSNACRAPPVIC